MRALDYQHVDGVMKVMVRHVDGVMWGSKLGYEHTVRGLLEKYQLKKNEESSFRFRCRDVMTRAQVEGLIDMGRMVRDCAVGSKRGKGGGLPGWAIQEGRSAADRLQRCELRRRGALVHDQKEPRRSQRGRMCVRAVLEREPRRGSVSHTPDQLYFNGHPSCLQIDIG